LASGAGLSAVAQQLGHAEGSTTLRAYRTVLPHQGKRLAAQLAALRAPPSGGTEDAAAGHNPSN